jgi:hypothetical protein
MAHPTTQLQSDPVLTKEKLLAVKVQQKVPNSHFTLLLSCQQV